jgi:hypothetical protein
VFRQKGWFIGSSVIAAKNVAISCRRCEKRKHLNSSIILLFGQKTATAVAFVKKGAGLIKVNGVPISLLQPEILKLKTFEPVLLIGTEKFANVSFSYLR